MTQWFGAKGVQTDHNAIYRAYRKHPPPEAAEKLDQEMSLMENARGG